MTDREFLQKLADWLAREADIKAEKAADLLSKGDAAALHWSGVAQGYKNIAAMIEAHCTKPAAAGDQPEVEGAPV